VSAAAKLNCDSGGCGAIVAPELPRAGKDVSGVAALDDTIKAATMTPQKEFCDRSKIHEV
jgi:hypothetical protein